MNKLKIDLKDVTFKISVLLMSKIICLFSIVYTALINDLNTTYLH